MKISKAKFEKDLSKIKELTEFEINRGKYENSFLLIKSAAKLAYNLPYHYCDEDLESLLQKTVDSILDFHNFTPVKGKYIFYDCFGMDNRGLTQQYIRALIDWQVDFLYIFEATEKSKIDKDILNELSNYSNAEIFIPNHDKSNIGKAQEIIITIERYKPEFAFLHFAPWSVIGVGIWNKINNVKRYFIDLTDHTFWLGKYSSDYFIGFRDYGYTISKNYRYIDPVKLLRQQYYPISNGYKFEGFPKASDGKIKIFCGANFYKIYGRNGEFLKILKLIIELNDNCVILIAGSGYSKPLKDFISENKLVDRIILIGDRKDIEEVVRNSDIFLCTYPVGGALMAQYALKNSIPTIAFTTENLILNDLSGFYKGEIIADIQYYDLNEFLKHISLLVADHEFRLAQSNRLSNMILKPDEFTLELSNLLRYSVSKFQKEIIIDNDAICDLYLEVENDWLRQYELIKISTLKWSYLQIDFLGAISDSIMVIIKKPNKLDLFNKLISKLSKIRSYTNDYRQSK